MAFSCLLNCLRVSLLGFFLTRSMMRVRFVRRLCRLCPVLFVSVGGAYDVGSSCKDLITLSLKDEGQKKL